MMHGTEKSDSVIVARKPANKAQQSTPPSDRFRACWETACGCSFAP